MKKRALMETEHVRTSCKNDKVEELSVPPGFVSLTSFTLKKFRNGEELCSSVPTGIEFELGPAQIDTSSDMIDVSKLKCSLGLRPWILHDHFNHDPVDSNSGPLDTDDHLKTCLPKGVIRGCSTCNSCQKVTARWRPGEACKFSLEEVPVFHPTEQEFKDTVEYVASIRPQVEPYGICRIVPPPTWEPPCIITEKKIWENSTFTTHIQPIDELQSFFSKKKLQGMSVKMEGGRKRTSGTDLKYGSGDGFSTHPERTGDYTGVFDYERGPEFTLEAFKTYADEFKGQYFLRESDVADGDGNSSVFQEKWEPSVENIEGEYWRIVENPSNAIEVVVAELETRYFGSGFPVVFNSAETPEYSKFVDSGWNLNNISKLPGSLLAFEDPDSDVLYPLLDIGMCFSSHCWRVEEHHLYSLRYMHLGSPKIWYGVPGRYVLMFEAVMKKNFPDLPVKYPGLLYNLVAQLSPSTLKAAGIPVYRCVQHPREFILIVPGAYHSEIDCGYNCSEAAYFAPFDWLHHGQNTAEVYSEHCRKTSISYDKLLLRAALEAVRAQWEHSLMRQKNNVDNLRWKDVCGKDGILTKALKCRVKREAIRREHLCSSSQSQLMEKDFDAIVKRECSLCHYDLHLSASGCPCSRDRYTCLKHAKKLCSCAWSTRFFLFKYEISDLNALVEALEGKLSAVYRWAKDKLGLTMHSLPARRLVGDTFSSAEKYSKQRDSDSENAAAADGVLRSLASELHPDMRAPVLQIASLGKSNVKENAIAFKSSSSETSHEPYLHKRKRSEVVADYTSLSSDTGFQSMEKEITRPASNLKPVTCLSREVESFTLPHCSSAKQQVEKCCNASLNPDPLTNMACDKETTESSSSWHRSSVIVLSDNEGDGT